MQNGRASKGPSLNFYLTVSLVGAMRGGLCLFLEHPLESIKTQWQDKTNFRTSREIVKDIYASKGLLGFYRGFVPNFIRVTSKHFYRWPLMLFFPNFYQRNIPKKYSNRFSGLNKILTGLTIANIEIFIHCPLDRIKIYFMTSNFQGYINGSSKIAYFYKTYRNNLLYELARGFGPTFWRSNVSWVSFLYLDHKVKQVFKSLRKTEVLSFMDLLLVSIFVGTGNLMMIMPFDYVKTQMQKDGFIKEGTFSIIKNHWKNFGLGILYTGWQFKILQYLVQSFFTVFTLDRLEAKSKSY